MEVNIYEHIYNCIINAMKKDILFKRKNIIIKKQKHASYILSILKEWVVEEKNGREIDLC